MIRYLLYAVAGYLCGSLMLAKWLPQLLCRVDTVTPSDDLNPGVFNAFRYGGIKCGIPALLGDLMKGCVPVLLAARRLDAADPHFALVIIAPVIGHMLPVWSRFRGGKGIAVSFGVLLALSRVSEAPLLLLAGLYIFFSVVAVIDSHLWRSVVTFALFGLLSQWAVPLKSLKLGCALIGAVVTARHARARRDEAFTVHLSPFRRS